MVFGGFAQLLKPLAENVDIRFNQSVCSVSIQTISEKQTIVNVKTEKGNQFKCRYCILTPSPPVLRDIEFTPKLPQSKQLVLEKMKMGLLNIVVFEFSSLFWPPEINFIGVTETNETFPLFLNIFPITGKPILMCQTYGDFAKRIEKMKENEIIDLAMKQLRKAIPNAQNPIRCKFSKWQSDRHIKGGYFIANSEESTLDCCDILAESIGNKLFFAGEASDRELNGLVHGGINSGQREAFKILQLMGRTIQHKL